jgi:hypothetical protein
VIDEGEKLVFTNVMCNWCRRPVSFYQREDDKVVCEVCRFDDHEAVERHLYSLPDDTDFDMVEIYS